MVQLAKINVMMSYMTYFEVLRPLIFAPFFAGFLFLIHNSVHSITSCNNDGALTADCTCVNIMLSVLFDNALTPTIISRKLQCFVFLLESL